MIFYAPPTDPSVNFTPNLLALILIAALVLGFWLDSRRPWDGS